MTPNFDTLGLDQNLLKAIEDLGFETPSPIQQQAIPYLLEHNQDLIALAQTGTGKTAAFGLPLLQKLDYKSKDLQAVIIAPTRELCLQITNELQSYGKYLKPKIVPIYGGANIMTQIKQIRSGVQVVVATAGRMKDLMQRKVIDLSKVYFCVLDEADEMLNMGFFEEIRHILSFTPKERKTWLFSATMPPEVDQIAKDFMKHPHEIIVGTKNKANTSVSHTYYPTNMGNKYGVLTRVLEGETDIVAIIFCRTKLETQRIALQLSNDSFSVGALHGDLTQNQRDLVMNSFRNKQIKILVATDVAARGIDVNNVTHVIHYQLPDDVEVYTHRSGRTGRAGNLGQSVALISQSDKRKIRSIERIIGQKVEEKEILTHEALCKKKIISYVDNLLEISNSTETETYLEDLGLLEKIHNLSKEELFMKQLGKFFTETIATAKKNDLLEAQGRERKSNHNIIKDTDQSRFFINLGAKDGFDWKKLKDFLKDTLNLGRDEVSGVDVKDTFSFFNVTHSMKHNILNAFDGMEYKGRRISIEESKGGGGIQRRKKTYSDRPRRPRMFNSR